MIKAYNRRQILRALGHFTVSLISAAATYGFFLWFITILNSRAEIPFLKEHLLWIPAWAVGLCFLSGFFHTWKENDFVIGSPTDLFNRGHFVSTQGAFEKTINSYAANAAYGFSMLFSAGPNRFLLACQCLGSLMWSSATLEEDLKSLLARIDAVGEWHDAKRYRAEASLLRHLVKMEEVDFSPSKARIKAA